MFLRTCFHNLPPPYLNIVFQGRINQPFMFAVLPWLNELEGHIGARDGDDRAHFGAVRAIKCSYLVRTLANGIFATCVLDRIILDQPSS